MKLEVPFRVKVQYPQFVFAPCSCNRVGPSPVPELLFPPAPIDSYDTKGQHYEESNSQPQLSPTALH